MAKNYSIPYFGSSDYFLTFEQELVDTFQDFLQSRQYILGNTVQLFENEFSAYCGLPFSTGTGNGYDALVLALKASKLPKGSRILVPAHTFIATIFAILACEYHPILIDSDLATANISVQALSNPPLADALMVVHMYGKPCEMEQIQALCKKHNWILFEDFSQAVGASFNGKLVGSWGDITASSLYPTKNLGALGDAGIVCCASKPTDEYLKAMRSYGSTHRNLHTYQGINSRLDALQARFLSIFLKNIDSFLSKKRALAKQYIEGMSEIEGIDGFEIHPKAYDTWHLMVFKCQEREALKEFLMEKGVETDVHYPTPTHLQPSLEFLGYTKGSFPIAEKLSNEVLSFPLYPSLTEDSVAYICDLTASFYERG